MTETFFTSDHHFGHRAVIRYSNRPWQTTDEMDEALIRVWNERVGTNDIVYYLGDFSFHKTELTREIFDALHGRMHFIFGNHDRYPAWLEERFLSAKDFAELKIDGTKVVLCHYPLLTWNKSHHGSWHLHGHCHGSLVAPPTRRLDVGVDARPNKDYAPWHWDEIVEFMRERPYEVVDHHGRGAE